MLAFHRYIDLDQKKKPKVEDSDATEHYGNDIYKISTKTDSVLDDIIQEKPFAKSKEQEIDPYEPKQEDKFKSKAISFKDFDDLLIGFDDGPLKSNPLADRDNTALFGKVSPEELMMSNLETQAGTSNKLNRLMRQKDTGETMEDIREGDKIADKQVNKDFDTNFSEFMKLYKDEVDELPSNKKKEFREGVKNVKATDKIRRKGLQSKTIIQPISGRTMPPIIEEIIKAKKNKVSKMTEGKFNLPKPKKIERTGDEGSIAPIKKLEPKLIRRNKMPDKIGEDEPAQSRRISKKVLETIPEQKPEQKPEKKPENKKTILITRPKLAKRSKSVEIPKLYAHEIPNVSPKGPLTEKLTVKIMKEMAKDQHIKRYSTMNKSQLIKALSFDTKDFPKFKPV